MNIIEIISQPWHWSVSGVMIVVVMFLLTYFGQRFGVSTSFKAMCAMVDNSKKWDYFNINWKDHKWLLTFVAGAVIGGWIATHFLASPSLFKFLPILFLI